MNLEEKVLNFITTIRASFGGSIAIYTHGNCYQFYEILKQVFPEAEPYDVGGHVWTKIDGKYYDIRDKQDNDKIIRVFITDPDRIKSLSVNKWTDERRKEYGMGEKINQKVKEAKVVSKKDKEIISKVNLDDVKEGLVLAISLSVYTDIIFEGQTKDKLSGVHLRAMIRNLAKDKIETYLNAASNNCWR